MKQTNINIDEIKRYPTVTNPIKADDLHTPQAYAYTLRRAIVTDCNERQRAELVKLLEGKESAEGVTFNNTKANRDRLHSWQNSESRKERAAILGNGWQWIEGLNHGTQPGDVITCIDGTRGRVTKSDAEICVIEFETENGQRLNVAGYFRYTPSEKLRNSESKLTTSRINFGILINLNINNSHYLQKYDRLKHDTSKIDVHNYLKAFDRPGYSDNDNEDRIVDCVKMFSDDAKWIKSFDGCGAGTSFYLVCYLTDKEGNPTGIEIIKELFYK